MCVFVVVVVVVVVVVFVVVVVVVVFGRVSLWPHSQDNPFCFECSPRSLASRKIVCTGSTKPHKTARVQRNSARLQSVVCLFVADMLSAFRVLCCVCV
jgi:hypothetical protein